MCRNSMLCIAPAARRFEQQFEVVALPGIDDVQHDFGPELLGPVADRRQVGRGIRERAVALADDEGGIRRRE